MKNKEWKNCNILIFINILILYRKENLENVQIDIKTKDEQIGRYLDEIHKLK